MFNIAAVATADDVVIDVQSVAVHAVSMVLSAYHLVITRGHVDVPAAGCVATPQTAQLLIAAEALVTVVSPIIARLTLLTKRAAIWKNVVIVG